MYLPDPAIAAHLDHHGDSLGVCELPPTEPPAECENPVEGAAIVVSESTVATNVPGVVDAGDVLSIAGDFELAASGTISVTVQDTDGTQGTFEMSIPPAVGDNAEITQAVDGSLLITVTGPPTNVAGGDNELNTTGLTGVSSEGISCADEVVDTPDTTEAVDGAVPQPTLSALAFAAYTAQ